MKQKALAINGVLIVILTAIINTVLHEAAHFVAANLLHVPAVLHHNYVQTADDTPERPGIIIAAAGPLFSLFFGLIVSAVSIHLIRPGLLKLFTLWLGMGGLLTFFGYLLIAPIATNGDTGRVFNYLGIPIYVSIAIAVGAFVYINKMFGAFARYFVYYSPSFDFDKLDTSRQLFLYPIYGSIIIVTLLSLPVITWVSLLPTIFMPMTFFGTMGAYRRMTFSTPTVIIDKVSTWLVILTLVSVAVFRYLV